MSAGPMCRTCGTKLQDRWVACPECGAEVKPVRATSHDSVESAREEGGRDLSRVGIGLIGLGVLGFGALLVGALNIRSMHDPSSIVVVGGGLVIAIMVGTVLLTRKAGRSAQVGTTIATGCLSVIATLGIGAIAVLAMVIYAFSTCFGLAAP
jgi:hypothetical protein